MLSGDFQLVRERLFWEVNTFFRIKKNFCEGNPFLYSRHFDLSVGLFLRGGGNPDFSLCLGYYLRLLFSKGIIFGDVGSKLVMTVWERRVSFILFPVEILCRLFP